MIGPIKIFLMSHYEISKCLFKLYHVTLLELFFLLVSFNFLQSAFNIKENCINIHLFL